MMQENTGLLVGRRPTDYIAGASPLGFEVRNESGDWDAFLPSGENQWSNRGDSMSCVSFSAINAIETQEKFLTGSAPNYSDRWIAKMSNTMRNGNYLWAVADAIRKYGLVLEEDYRSPLSYTWDEYHADIPPAKLEELLAKGKEWLKKWSISYEWVTPTEANLELHQKHAPLQVTIPGHAIEEVQQRSSDFRYFDTYFPYLKSRAGLPEDALKIVLTRINAEESMKLIQDGGTVFLVGTTGKLGIADEAALKSYTDLGVQVEQGSTAGVPQLGIVSTGVIVHRI